jgi:hypothetical protein
MITKTKLEVWTTYATGIATLLLLALAIYMGFGSSTQQVGRVGKTFQEDGVNKVEFVNEEGTKTVLECTVPSDEMVGKKVKLKIFRLPLMPPRITHIEQEKQ